jgi:hypothetical protein
MSILRRLVKRIERRKLKKVIEKNRVLGLGESQYPVELAKLRESTLKKLKVYLIITLIIVGVFLILVARLLAEMRLLTIIQ